MKPVPSGEAIVLPSCYKQNGTKIRPPKYSPRENLNRCIVLNAYNGYVIPIQKYLIELCNSAAFGCDFTKQKGQTRRMFSAGRKTKEIWCKYTTLIKIVKEHTGKANRYNMEKNYCWNLVLLKSHRKTYLL